MGLFDKLFGEEITNDSKQPIGENAASHDNADGNDTMPHSSKDAINMMIIVANQAMENGDYKRAAEGYKNILKLEPNVTAQYNLGSLYAQGKGVKQDFMEGAYWFRQAELRGDDQAGKLCIKCTIDFVHQDFDKKSHEQLYTDMVRLVKYVYPETEDVNLEACRKLFAIGGNHFNRKEYQVAAKLFRTAAEFGNDGYSQNYLAVLYNLGAGVKQNDLAALYWFDKAVDNGAADVALKDRDGMLNAYKTNFTPAEFYEEMIQLSGWCGIGYVDVPKDAVKSAFWREIGESWVKESAEK